MSFYLSVRLSVSFSLLQKLLHLQNFNTLMAVVGGLSHSSISRLKETHSHLSPEVTKVQELRNYSRPSPLSQLVIGGLPLVRELMSPLGNVLDIIIWKISEKIFIKWLREVKLVVQKCFADVGLMFRRNPLIRKKQMVRHVISRTYNRKSWFISRTVIFSCYWQIWNEMTELVSSNGNYCAYRKAFSESEGFKIPILGVHLKDLIAVHVVFPDWVEDGKVNIVKMQQLYLTFNELVSLQSAVAQVEPNMDLIYLLTVSSAYTSVVINLHTQFKSDSSTELQWFYPQRKLVILIQFYVCLCKAVLRSVLHRGWNLWAVPAQRTP